jgi:hypothetical protein
MTSVIIVKTMYSNNDLGSHCWATMRPNNDPCYAGCLVPRKNVADRQTGNDGPIKCFLLTLEGEHLAIAKLMINWLLRHTNIS